MSMSYVVNTTVINKNQNYHDNEICMYDLNPFVLLLFSHIIGDVVFASHRLAILKRSHGVLKPVIGLTLHSLIHAVFAGLLLQIGKYNWLRGTILVFVFHFIIDFVRSNAEVKRFGAGMVYVKRSEFRSWLSGKTDNTNKMNVNNLKPWFLINILDQVSHVISLFIVSILLI